jgi:hypothetical protein
MHFTYMVRPRSENGKSRTKMALKWMPKQKRARGRLDGRYKEGHERKKPK